VATSGQLEDREALFFVNRQQLQDAPAKRALARLFHGFRGSDGLKDAKVAFP
jgi:hypothetical protein